LVPFQLEKLKHTLVLLIKVLLRNPKNDIIMFLTKISITKFFIGPILVSVRITGVSDPRGGGGE